MLSVAFLSVALLILSVVLVTRSMATGGREMLAMMGFKGCGARPSHDTPPSKPFGRVEGVAAPPA